MEPEAAILPTFKFLGFHLSEDLKWDVNTDHSLKKAQQCLFFLRRMKNFGLGRSALVKFYRAVIESSLCLHSLSLSGTEAQRGKTAIESTRLCQLHLECLDVSFLQLVIYTTAEFSKKREPY